jgi:hypothetical protein
VRADSTRLAAEISFADSCDNLRRNGRVYLAGLRAAPAKKFLTPARNSALREKGRRMGTN